MLAYLTLLTAYIVATVTTKGIQFIECPCNETLLLTKCTDKQLPNGCECYDISEKSDYTNTGNTKPMCPDKINVIFYLYTRVHKTTPQKIKAGQAYIKSTSYNGAKKTVFITHGFTDNGLASWCIDIKDSLLRIGDMNVITVDWQQGAQAPSYCQAAANIRVVGSMVARLIYDMNTIAQAGFDNFHLIGHDLGAHLMGYAGKEVFRLTEEKHKVGRISGLDPAGPAFTKYSTFVRIDSTDAQFVDIMHTDQPETFRIGVGIQGNVGHMDYYPNGGSRQPGCAFVHPVKTSTSCLNVFEGSKEMSWSSCSHDRAREYFNYSIDTCEYDTIEPDCSMGYNVSAYCKGTFRFTTLDKAPYC